MTESRQSVVEPNKLANVLQHMNDVIETFIALREQDERDEQTSFWMGIFHEEAKAIASTLAELGLITKAERVGVMKSIEWTQSKAEIREVQQYTALEIEACILYGHPVPRSISSEDRDLVIELQSLIAQPAGAKQISAAIDVLVGRGLLDESLKSSLVEIARRKLTPHKPFKVRKIVGLTETGRATLLDHIARTGNEAELPFEEAFSGLVTMISSQMNNPNRDLACEPWYCSIGVAGTTYPKGFEEHETSDYEELCLSYYASDFIIEPVFIEENK